MLKPSVTFIRSTHSHPVKKHPAFHSNDIQYMQINQKSAVVSCIRRSALILTFASSLCLAGSRNSGDWDQFIEADFPSGCVFRMDIYDGFLANSGVSQFYWIVQTCQGDFQYRTDYIPPELSPNQDYPQTQRLSKISPMTRKQLRNKYSFSEEAPVDHGKRSLERDYGKH